MISSIAERIALTAVHDLLVQGRIMSVKKASPETFFKFFDDVEYLQILVISVDDWKPVFEMYLKEMCERFDCESVWTRYERRSKQGCI